MTTVHEENERKYDGALDRQLTADGLSQVSGVVPGGTEKLNAVYYDTPDLRLLRSGITLRRRSGGGDAGWHLKTPGSNGIRVETRLPLAAGHKRPPKELVRLVRGAARGERLAPVARLRTDRTVTLLVDADHRTLAEMVRDRVSAKAPSMGTGPGSERTEWTETEVELADGDPGLLDEVEERLRARGLRRSAASSKLGRVLGARLEAPADRAEPPKGSVAAALTGYLREQVAAVHALDPAVRLDRPDSVHRLRVTVRRIRSALAAHRKLLDRAVTDPLDKELRRFGKVLGRARDAEVLGERLAGQASGLPAAGRPAEVSARISARYARRYRRAHRTALQAMDGGRYFALLNALDELAARPPLRKRARRGTSEARKVLERQRRRAVRRLGTALGLPPGSERDRALHRARKAAKRARYAAECAAPAAGRPAERLRKRMKGIQRPLGAHQDGVVAEPAIRDAAAEARRHGEDTFGYGLLYAAQRSDEEQQVAAAAKARKKARKKVKG
ncbi:CYTH and CHAD domain-containing protein [Kitasatospora sp. DSM 101779]|uniref:CYTH and CHAD domain-containing protein n=1 Tax=Kitasatospora sp. DSM 101779 TaxID=2853165 RepID=UPI0021D890DE|nr:CYTH and CHAD domain-containing protein [Kitasatospora sp. DSM 101779]MCU7826336.1 CYTH and CHAD domain-containing protein [Kitasatospora sp. DSM 101779]